VADSLAEGQRLVFVGGLHRSGTSLLAQLIADHPQGSGLSGTEVPEDEGQHLQQVYPPARTFGGPGRFAHDSAAHLTESSPLATPANAERLLTAWRPYWDNSKQYLVEKSPPNLIMSRFLQSMFPDPYFLFIVRHPVSVTLATRKWRARMPLPRLMNHWFVAHDAAQSDLPMLRRIHIVSYEWLLAEPAETLSDVADFLGLESPIDFALINPERGSPYAEQWQRMLDEGDRGARAAVKRYAEAAARFEYDINDPARAPREPLAQRD
jgi:hypothetical protein